MRTVIKTLKIIGIVILSLVAIVILFFGYLTVVEYKPDSVEKLEFSAGNETVSVGDSLEIVTYNIGYAGYDQDEDFFMDGGNTVRQDSVEPIQENISKISSQITQMDADVYFLQEVDIDSRRSFNINEQAYINAATGIPSTLAINYKVPFVPFPIPPIGKVESGIATVTKLNIQSAERYALPCPFNWPIRLGNLKRCLLEERIPLENSGKELVLVNLHLEAYDDGEGKKAQTDALMKLIKEEYDLGNYVIAGGDFNQSFDVIEPRETLYPDDWMPGYLSSEELPEGFSFAVADNAATCRSLARAYVDEENSQEYIIDGFIVSDNCKIESVQVVDYDFMYSDHNPVKLTVKIK